MNTILFVGLFGCCCTRRSSPLHGGGCCCCLACARCHRWSSLVFVPSVWHAPYLRLEMVLNIHIQHSAFGSPSSNPTTDKVAEERHSWLASSAMRSGGMPVILHLFFHPVKRRRLHPDVASSATKEYYFWIVALVAVVRWTAFRGWTLKKWINIVTRNGIRQKWFAGRHTQYLIYSS